MLREDIGTQFCIGKAHHFARVKVATQFSQNPAIEQPDVGRVGCCAEQLVAQPLIPHQLAQRGCRLTTAQQLGSQFVHKKQLTPLAHALIVKAPKEAETKPPGGHAHRAIAVTFGDHPQH